MKAITKTVLVTLLLLGSLGLQAAELSDISNTETRNVVVSKADFKDSEAIVLAHTPGENGFGADAAGQEGLMLWKDVNFTDGTIELDIASELVENAPAQARGFVGIAFRVKTADDYEAIYLRPTNGRANNQLRRNHSVQYISHPDFTWFSLRKNEPGKYETYVDLVLGEWTHVKIEVAGTSAKLYVHGNQQPTLIINDLKHGESAGSIALWVGIGTKGYFKNIQVQQ
jgi:hypothetical protein